MKEKGERKETRGPSPREKRQNKKKQKTRKKGEKKKRNGNCQREENK
jgi:hypothetical protein